MHRNILATHLWKIKEKQSLIQKAKLALDKLEEPNDKSNNTASKSQHVAN